MDVYFFSNWSESKSKILLKNFGKRIEAAHLQPNYFVISGRRWALDNYILNKFAGAAKKVSNAIDIIVLDVNGDGEINGNDVDLIYTILNKKIIRDFGGIGTYKNGKGFFSRQMVHFDCRGKKARWNR